MNEQRSVQQQMAARPQAVPVREAAPLSAQPVTPGDWVTVMRHQAEQIDGQRLSSREHDGFIALQRQVAHTLVQGFRQDRQAPDARYPSTATTWPPCNGIPTAPPCHGWS
ncbi:hypothetical protein [Deinococcus sp. Arct2-2]|uniref:hypothetical protein n=1 Tax=Deinococcus sp. Arct2-2 TaxID=2568653 RepID=UPI001F0E6A8C|nr:hypothetical protein [Deinococcus sp. Arct2-2]